MEKESAAEIEEGNSSTEVSIPFSWESRPGTPRVKLRETPLPPLTPPPSYYYNLDMSSTPSRPVKKLPKPRLLSFILQRCSGVTRRPSGHLPSSPASSSSSSSSSVFQPWRSRSKSYSLPSSPVMAQYFLGYSSTPRQSYKKKEVEDEEEDREYYEELEPPVSTTLCFGKGARASSRGCWYLPFTKVVVH